MFDTEVHDLAAALREVLDIPLPESRDDHWKHHDVLAGRAAYLVGALQALAHGAAPVEATAASVRRAAATIPINYTPEVGP